MGEYDGVYSQAWTELQRAINDDGLRDIILHQTDTGKCDIIYSETVPEYGAARDTGVELGITATNNPGEPETYTLTTLLSRIGLAIHFHLVDMRNTISLISEILTGRDRRATVENYTMEFFEPHNGNHNNPTSPPRTMRPQPPDTPGTIRRPEARRI
jgi:hypothetical protein